MAPICRGARALALVLFALVPAACAPADSQRRADVGPTSVLIADFVNSTGDPIFEPALKHALAVALAESPRLHVFDGPRVADSLRALNRSADERVTADLAWEVAVREEIDMLVLGSIDAPADGYLLTIEAVASGDGATLARETARAAGRAGVVDALGRAALNLRRSLGEPAAAVARSDRPLTQATTASLDALAHYAAGREHADKGRHALAAPYYCRALALDPRFDLARSALQAIVPDCGMVEAPAQAVGTALDRTRPRINRASLQNVHGEAEPLGGPRQGLLIGDA